MVGAPDGDGSSANDGYAYVFQYTDPDWQYSPKLHEPTGAGSVDFGASVAIDGRERADVHAAMNGATNLS